MIFFPKNSCEIHHDNSPFAVKVIPSVYQVRLMLFGWYHILLHVVRDIPFVFIILPLCCDLAREREKTSNKHHGQEGLGEQLLSTSPTTSSPRNQTTSSPKSHPRSSPKSHPKTNRPTNRPRTNHPRNHPKTSHPRSRPKTNRSQSSQTSRPTSRPTSSQTSRSRRSRPRSPTTKRRRRRCYRR